MRLKGLAVLPQTRMSGPTASSHIVLEDGAIAPLAKGCCGIMNPRLYDRQ